jgi:hypothetical protein
LQLAGVGGTGGVVPGIGVECRLGPVQLVFRGDDEEYIREPRQQGEEQEDRDQRRFDGDAGAGGGEAAQLHCAVTVPEVPWTICVSLTVSGTVTPSGLGGAQL